MVHDKKLCEECRYNKIEGYALKIRHCNKCENYGEKVLEASVIIIQKPTDVKIYCPHCDEPINVEINKFEDLMGSEYPGDWVSEIVECPNCEKGIKIADYEWN